MKTVVVARMNPETGMVDLEIQSDCPNVLKMSWALQPICPYSEVEAAFCETDTYKLASETIPHAACPVPCGIIKAIEVAGGLGLKRDAIIKVE
jgi:hypothetical protein